MTAVMNKFSLEMFSSLPHFDEAKLIIPSIQEKIHILGSIIKKHGIRHAGVSLLHKHFDLNANERLVEYVDKPHVSELKAVDLPDEMAIPYMWKFSSNGWYPLEFTSLVTEELMQRTLGVISNACFLQEFGEALNTLEVA